MKCRRTFAACCLVLALLSGGCGPFIGRFVVRSFEQLGSPVETVKDKIADPVRPGVRLSVLWIGHASFLIQMDDKIILTDPVFTQTVGLLATRSIEAGLDVGAIRRADVITISHLHFDHLSYGSLGMLPKEGVLVIPAGGAEYTPDFGFAETKELKPWESLERDGVRVTAVPVQHFGGRYGFDLSWSAELGYTGYVIQYDGMTVFIAGDTAYNPEFFKETGRRFAIDLALIPIGPVAPRSIMSRVHADPASAVQIFEDLHARFMVPMHYETFFQGLDSTQHQAREELTRVIREKKLEERVLPMRVGEQRDLSAFVPWKKG